MESCPYRPVALRTLVAVLAVLVAAVFAFQVRDGGLLETRPSAGRFVANAFPTAEATVVSGR